MSEKRLFYVKKASDPVTIELRKFNTFDSKLEASRVARKLTNSTNVCHVVVEKCGNEEKVVWQPIVTPEYAGITPDMLGILLPKSLEALKRRADMINTIMNTDGKVTFERIGDLCHCTRENARQQIHQLRRCGFVRLEGSVRPGKGSAFKVVVTESGKKFANEYSHNIDVKTPQNASQSDYEALEEAS